MNRLVRARTLGDLLGVDRTTVYRWSQSGLLRPRYILQEPHFLDSEIDHMLAACLRTMARAPTYADLYSGRVVLVRKSVAGSQLGMTEATVETQLNQSRLDGIQLGRYWYVVQASIEHYLQVAQYTPARVCHMIGLSYGRMTRRTFAELVDSGRLKRHLYSGRSGIFVTEDSLDAYLGAHLPRWVIPSLWREERLDDPRPLLSLEEIAARINRRHLQTVQHMLEAERLACIWLPGRRIRRYSPTAFDTYMELEIPPSRAEVGRWFGVHPTAINLWRGQALIHCPLRHHHHPPMTPFYESCWAAIIKPLLAPGMDPNGWIASRKRSNTQLLGRQLAAARLKIAPDQVTALAEAGALRGIRTPAGEWRFSEHALARVHAKM